MLYFYLIFVLINTNPPFQKNSAVIVSQIENVKNSASLIKTTIIERDFKNEYLFRTCSVTSNLVTSLEFYSDLCDYALRFLASDGRVPYSLVLTLLAALEPTVLHENREPFRSGLVEKRNRTVK